MSPVFIRTRITKSGKRYAVCYRRGGRGFPEEYAGTFTSQRDAKIRRDLVAGELAAGRDPQILLAELRTPPPAAPGLEETWLEFETGRIDVGAKAQEQYRSARKAWLPILGPDTDPASITPTKIVNGIAKQAETLAPSTISKYLSSLTQVLDHAGVEPNPCRSPRVKLPRARKGEKEIPGNETWFAIRDAVFDRSRLALELEEACAFRVSEACALELGDIDFVDGAARIREEGTKTRAGRRWVPIPRPLLDRIEAQLPPLEDRHADMRVLGVTADLVYRDLVRACKDAGAPRYGTHALRHRRISLWLRHGIDPIQVAAWSGHARPSESLDTYGHQVIDPNGDEWARFWKTTYERSRRLGADPVRTEEVIDP